MLSSSNRNNNDNLMNFKVLSRYDDLFTDIFLDNLFLWFNTIKMNNDHRRPRVPNNKILDIIQRHVLEKAKPMDAVHELLSMDYFKHYLALKNQKQIQEFISHMKRYLYMYMPNAGYEVGDTRRYGGNGRRVEACLIATKDWFVGDEMRLLTGMIACLDPKDDAELKKGNRDFSVMWSTRKNCSCLFLGPARFANHDCDSNCKFIASSQNSIIFKVVKDIKYGEEITVFYGKHYFGENNCECKCVTCERLGMGYFASLESKESTPIDIKEEELGVTRRSTRKRKSALHEESSQNTSRKTKRASIEPLQKPSDSLEDLIGEMSSPTIANLKSTELPLSPTTATTARLKVMSIDFLCGSDEEDHTVNRRTSDCPLLDMLVDAAMDAEYLKEKKTNQITVVVNPDIQRDAANRVRLQQQLPDSPHSNESKADSAVSLSPRIIKKEEQPQQDLLNDDMDALDDFLDDVSDLSSVSSTELSSWDEEEEAEESAKKKQQQQREQDLVCIACSKPLRRQDISEQVGADVAITNELATWTWSPSAIFTDWRPKRCPRCERHYTIFKQEWPSRKLKKKKENNRKKPQQKKQKKKSIQPPPQPTPQTPIFQIQDDPNDLNYIPPSPLSDIIYDEE